MVKSDILKIVAIYAKKYGVSAALIASIIQIESGFNQGAKNLTGGDLERGGAWGLMQMTLKTAKNLGFMGDPKLLLIPSINIDYGTKLLAQIQRRVKKVIRTESEIDRNIVSIYNSGKFFAKAPSSTLEYVARWSNAIKQYRDA